MRTPTCGCVCVCVCGIHPYTIMNRLFLSDHSLSLSLPHTLSPLSVPAQPAQVLVRKRDAAGLLAGLWELPNTTLTTDGDEPREDTLAPAASLLVTPDSGPPPSAFSRNKAPKGPKYDGLQVCIDLSFIHSCIRLNPGCIHCIVVRWS